jgi:P4 family phage/plasmid primase-like protien
LSTEYHIALIASLKLYIDKLNLPINPCNGKTGIVKDWPNKRMNSHNEISDYFHIENLTLGLVLGKISNIIGIDIDGSDASDYLKSIANGNLVKTWCFKTPSGGMRLLYFIPEGTPTPKRTKKFPGEHSELALLGDGCQSIMPPSVIQGYGAYTWFDGTGPDNCDIAQAPSFILEIFKNGFQEKVIDLNIPTVEDTELVLTTLDSRCPLFHQHYHLQKTGELDEDAWFLWEAVLVNSGYPLTANNFSKLSIKHATRSEKRLEDFKKSKAGPTSCVKLGCSEEQIRVCHGKVRTKSNDPSIITNSPGHFIKTKSGRSLAEVKSLADIGIYLNDSGNIDFLNGNIFARHILECFTLKYSNDLFYLYKDGLYYQLDPNDLSRTLRDFLHEYVPDSWTENRELGYIAALRRETPKVSQMNQDKSYINLENGVFLLNELRLVMHSPDFLTTIRIPIVYDPLADCPTYKGFEEEVFLNDKSLIMVSQEIQGYCLTSEVCAQKSFIMYGQGSNGKSVYLNTTAKLIGLSNISSVPLGELNKSFARYDLLNKTVNLVTETEISGKGFNSEYFKAIVAGDPIRAEIKNGPAFTFIPVCKMLIALNNLFYSSDTSHAFTRRLHIIPFNRTFTSEEADKHLEEKLTKELPGIFNQAIEGLIRLRANNFEFTKSEAVDSVLNDYKRSMNPFDYFVEDTIMAAEPLSKLSYMQISDMYTEWREDNGYSVKNAPSHITLASLLKKYLTKNGIAFGTIKSNGVRYITGLCFKNSTDTETAAEAAQQNPLFNQD